jgi:hypothetical protein
MNGTELIQECARLVPLCFWLGLCERTGVPYIPAEFSEPFSVVDLGDYLELEPTPRLRAALDWAYRTLMARLEADQRGRWTFRWECCSSSAVKCAAASGAGFSDIYYTMRVDDPRVFDCTVGRETRVCIRPWVEAAREGGYPVELRAFVGADGRLGISNYYPQRDLTETDELRSALQRVEFFAGALFGKESFPAGFTADFLVMPDFSVTLLEGGPPHVQGPISAHPCCMKPGDTTGIALARRPGALSF